MTSAPPLRRPATIATAALLLVTLAWGSSFVMTKHVVARVPVDDYLALRFGIATIAVLAVRPGSVRALSRRTRRTSVVLGLLYGGGQLLQTAGLHLTSAAVAGFVTGMYVVLTPLIGGVVLRQRIGGSAWAAVGIATVGLAVLSLRTGAGSGPLLGTGVLLVLGSTVLYALQILGLGAWSSPGDAIGMSVVQLGAITALCAVAAAPGGLTLPSGPAAWASVLYLAVVVAAMAMILQTWAQAHLPPTRAAVVMTMEPVFAGAFAVALGEALTWRMVAGGLLVVAAMYLVELGPRHGADAGVPHISAP